MIKNLRIKSLRNIFIIAGIAFAIPVFIYFMVLKINPFPYDALKNIEYSRCVLDKDGKLLRAFTGKDDTWLMPVELSEINPYFIKATLSIEDKRFMKHRGIDPFAVLRAIRLNVANKKIISGASTISMQTMRILEQRKRSMSNKIVEAVHAIRLETLCQKEKILKLYFEIAPYGGNIHGVKAASLRYFQKFPKDLTISECALLAGLPQSPSRLRPDKHPERAKQRRDRVLLNMLNDGYITSAQYEDAIKEPVLVKNHPFPFNSPHFAEFVKKNSNKPGNIITTLDSDIQHFAEASLDASLNELRFGGVTNGAIVIIENKTGKIRALVGSADFFSIENSGQINGALSKRCPGSTLKPFTYAIAFDEGILTPSMILADVRCQYSGYTPVDYDKDYRGPVTVREALVDSLNIPAVEVLDKIGFRRLYMFLKNAGISIPKPPDQYGLSLTLGSAEVNLLELTNAYAMLARLGVYKPYSFIEGEDTGASKRLLSEGAAYLVADILSDSERLRSIGIYRDEKIRPKVAWKTGTSYGHKDVWTVCYNPEYTIGVWLGNFSGKPTRALMGINAAAPIAIHLFDQLYAKKTNTWYERPIVIAERNVCAISGEPISEECPHSTKDLYIKNLTSTKKCDIHQKYAAVSRSDIDFDKNKPKIISPAHGCEYFVTGSQSANPELLLLANSAFDADQLYWFIDGKFFDKMNAGQKLFWCMKEGAHKITCADNYGRSSSVKIVVR